MTGFSLIASEFLFLDFQAGIKMEVANEKMKKIDKNNWKRNRI
jgi:hypothetical protein